MLAAPLMLSAYNDHRGHNLDSLEAVAASFAGRATEDLSEAEYETLLRTYDGLMSGNLQINHVACLHYAKKLHDTAAERNYLYSMNNSMRIVGQCFWAAEQYDSAAFYYRKALSYVERMEKGEGPSNLVDGYPEKTTEDAKSSLLGALGNLYNVMDSIPVAMDYYAKAGEIFERNGWNESNSVLWYNIGETWAGEKEYRKAVEAYEKSLDYARQSGDSLLTANALKGLGGVCMDMNKTRKALEYLLEADKYYSHHEDQEFRFRLETLDFMRQVLMRQKRTYALLGCSALALAILLIALMLILRKLKTLRKEKEGADEVIEEALAESGSETVNGESPDMERISLTKREEQILRLVTEGLTSQQIADRLFLSLTTIKWYRKRLLQKFGAQNTAELVFKAKTRPGSSNG